MKKVIVALAAVAMVGVATADIYVAPAVGYGISGSGDNGGIVNNIAGTEIVLTIYDGGGDGADGVQILGGVPTAAGNDTIIGSLFSAATGSLLDYADYGNLISGTIGGNGTPWSADTWVSVSGLNVGDGAWLAPITLINGNYSDPKTLPQLYYVDSADGSIGNAIGGAANTTVIPEPATIGLIGIAGLGMFLARKKVHA